MPTNHTAAVSDYNLEIVGLDFVQAVNIARKLEEGLGETADVCTLSPSVCRGNLGLARHEMPQIEAESTVSDLLESEDEDDRAKAQAMLATGADPDADTTVLEQFLDALASQGVKVQGAEVPVGKLRATQKEIQAEKMLGMADSHLRGKFDNIVAPILVSRDGYILDGHHRWAALLTISPSRSLWCTVIDMDIESLLAMAKSTPGVYFADFKGGIRSRMASRIASRYAALELTVTQVGDLLRGFQQQMRTMEEEVGGTPTPDPDSREWVRGNARAQITWGYLIRRYGHPLTTWIVETRAIPPGQAKRLEMAARVILASKNKPRDMFAWWQKNKPHLDYIAQAALWDKKGDGTSAEPDKDGVPELFDLGPFKVHNTLHFTGDKLDKVKHYVVEGAVLVRSAGYSNVLYGDVYIVGRIDQVKTLAWYYVKTDSLYVRGNIRGGSDEGLSLSHELGHRHWYKFMTQDNRQRWANQYAELKRTHVEVPKVGDLLGVPLQGFEPNELRITGLKASMRGFSYTLEPGITVSVDAVRNYLEGKARESKFPTAYAATSVEEYYAESFALNAFGKLDGVHLELLKATK